MELGEIETKEKEKGKRMNEEKKIAQAILDAQKMREESYEQSLVDNSGIGHYKRDMEECLIESCKKHGLSLNLWALLNLAMHWCNDIQLWAEDILAGRNVGEDTPCCDSPSKEKCDQCQEIGLANPLNH